MSLPGVQFWFSLQESNLIATITITIGFNGGSWFSYVNATWIITGIDSQILFKFAALSTQVKFMPNQLNCNACKAIFVNVPTTRNKTCHDGSRQLSIS